MKGHRYTQPIRLAQTQKFYNSTVGKQQAHTMTREPHLLRKSSLHVRVRKNLTRQFICLCSKLWMLSTLKLPYSFKAVSKVDTDKHLQCWQQHDPHIHGTGHSHRCLKARGQETRSISGAWMVLSMTEGVQGPASQCTSAKYCGPVSKAIPRVLLVSVLFVCVICGALTTWILEQDPGSCASLGGASGEEPAANAGDMGSIHSLRRSTCPRNNKGRVSQHWACALEPAICNHWAHAP